MFQDFYKKTIDLKGTQEERRRLLLDKQKEDRVNLQDKQRPIEEIFSQSLKDKKGNKGKITWQQKQQEHVERTFREIYDVDLSLQQSEWLRERPENMCDWLLVPCPKGQRSLVVAYNGQTAVYNRVGHRVCVFRSLLPGDGVENDALSILDCIFVREQNAFYVLDVLAFGGPQNLLHCEAEFRFFWLRSKWDDYENLEIRSASNQKPFHLVKQYDFENMIKISEALEVFPLWPNNKPELDGFLFYHRFASYTCGSTPLVGWLFPFMIFDVLGLKVNEQYNKPIDYSDPLNYMKLFDERLNNRRQRKNERPQRRSDQNRSNDRISAQKTSEKVETESDDEDTLKKLINAERALEMEEDFEEHYVDEKVDNTKMQILMTSA